MTNSGGGGPHTKLIRCRTDGSAAEAKVAGEKRSQDGRVKMDTSLMSMMGARHLSQIKEESDSREHSTCFLPPIVPNQCVGSKNPASRQDEHREVRTRPTSLVHSDQQRIVDENRSLLEELGCIEAELRESLRLDMERQQEDEFLRRQENKLLWQDLRYLTLSQRVAKPWVSSYFKMFPMHIYCLPVQPANQRRQRRGLKKKQG